MGWMDYFIPILQPSILADPHDRRKRHGPLVQRLQEIGQDHHHQHAPVNLPAQPLGRGLVDLDHAPVGILRNLLVDARLVDMVLGQALAVRENPLDMGRVFDVGHRLFLGVRHGRSWSENVKLKDGSAFYLCLGAMAASLSATLLV